MTPPPAERGRDATGSRRRVLFVHGSDEAYGSDRVLLDLATALADRDNDVKVLLPDDAPPGWLSRSLGSHGVDVRRGPLAVARRRYLTPARLPGYAGMLMRARAFVMSEAQRFAPDLIHVNTSSLLVAAFLPADARRRLVWHVHEIVVHPRPARWLFGTMPVRRARRVIAISDAVGRHLAAVAGERAARRVRVVPNGLPDRAPSRRANARALPRVAFIGRLNRWKGYEVFVDALPAVVDEVPEARFVIAGEPPAGEEWRLLALRERIHELSLDGHVQLPGYVPSEELMDEVEVVVVPSVWPEPFGLVTLEAMRAGRAVVATGHGASPELLDHGRSGVLVPPGDAPALAEALVSLLTDDDRRNHLAASARRRFLDRYTIDRFVSGVEGVYAEVERRG